MACLNWVIRVPTFHFWCLTISGLLFAPLFELNVFVMRIFCWWLSLLPFCSVHVVAETSSCPITEQLWLVWHRGQRTLIANFLFLSYYHHACFHGYNQSSMCLWTAGMWKWMEVFFSSQGFISSWQIICNYQAARQTDLRPHIWFDLVLINNWVS